MSEAKPFDGIRVAEFGQFIAVPFCGQMLADGGAEVLKIEAPEGDPTRRFNPLAPGESRIFLSRNRGKHSLPLHLSNPAARPVIERILAWADVVLINFRPGLEEKLGLKPEDLLAAHPRLVIASVTAFGKRGPDAGLAGMDIVLQARSGLMAANGRMIDGRPASGDPVSADYMCAMCLSFGVTSALFRRERTGNGGIVDVSLMQAAMTLANNQLVRSEDTDGPAHEAALQRLAEQRAANAAYDEQAAAIPNPRFPSMSAIYFRTFETADRAIAVACGSHSLRVKFAEVLGIKDQGLLETSLQSPQWDDYYAALKAEVESIVRQASAEAWIARLNEAGIPVAAVRFPIELFDDPHAHANRMFHDMEHPTAGTVRVLGPPVELDNDGFQPSDPTPAFGSETDRILHGLDFDAPEIEALVAAGVVGRQLRTPDEN
jgi:crotonobetainyl-CoA:carnitine CoA-transferase CaiB-like acyl-CoA transferase